MALLSINTQLYTASIVMFITIILTALTMTLIVALRYLVVSGVFAWITALIKPGHYSGQSRQIGREIRWSLYSAAIYGVPTGILAWGWTEYGWTQVYMDISDYPLWYLPLSLLLYLVLHDTWFYWTHRLMHRPKWFRIAHAVHHDSRPPTAWAAMSFHPIEALTGAVVIPALVLVVPIHVAMLGMVLAIMTLMAVTNHMGWELFPNWLVHGPLGKWLITATHHHRHHKEYLCNYGLYFRFWDYLCATDKGLTEWDSKPLAENIESKDSSINGSS